ncbi:PA0069 family radical SAM protein [Indioceanicola profundi]|uniref:PA0069 family radical SAM protein n=1 Tax=Indioceanicola profundi TaxID=2220096 RepID=UPI000E6ACB14|nr:PA0069 family radical SAM protein [Indioceanicola profundi]
MPHRLPTEDIPFDPPPPDEFGAPGPDDLLPDRAVKGRGAVSNRTGRFEREVRQRTDDGWSRPEVLAEETPPLRTTLADDATRTIIARNDSPDIPFDRSINPYRGCEHGCVYCFARPTHAFLGLSPGLDFETRLFRKPDAAKLLAAELRRKGYEPRPIALGANTDPYQPVEREQRITREVLEVLRDFRHPVGIVTKSHLVTRDIDILAEMAADGLAMVSTSITTLDRDLARTMEPRAGTPQRRLDAIRALSSAGIPTAVLASPMAPGLNDHEMESILEAAAEAGATYASYILLRLPLEISGLFEEWLHAHAPNRAARVLKLIREMRDGQLYQAGFGTRMRGTGPYADLLSRRFKLACRRLGLNDRRWDLDCGKFRPPPAPGDQLGLF